MKGRKPKPAAFMSYAHSDDDRLMRLTQFREDLSAEVQRQIGEEFLIFQDREDIRWGQNWKKRIEKSINEVTFFIPIITPSFFKSPCCCRELQQFLEHEKELERDDLVLPIYYIDCPLLNDKEERAGDKLAQAIADRHCSDGDWRELRFEPFTSPQVGKMLARLAVQIRDALERVQASGKPEDPKPDAGVTRRPAVDISDPMLPDIESVIKMGRATRGPFAKTEPPTRVVDQMHRGDHFTITEAIEAADPGDRILVRPGLYPEGLVIDKPGLEIIGDGNLDDVVVQAVGMGALLFKTTMGRVTNLTLRQMGGENWFGVDITQGRLELEGCDITSQGGLPCVAIHGGADPRLRRNRIHGGEVGVAVWENGQGVLEDNEIFGNTLFGVAIKQGGNPTLRHNRINKNDYWAVWVHDGGGGTIEDNDLSGNAKGAWDISADSEPNLKRARNKE